MKNIASTTLAALVLVAAGITGTPSAQPVASGDALQAQAERARDALLKGTHEEFFNAIAPWLQGRVRLNQEDTATQLKALREKDPGFEKEFAAELEQHLYGANGLDPGKLSGVKTLDDVINAKPSVVLALRYGFYKLRGLDELNTRLGTTWHLVDRRIGTTDNGTLIQQVGIVRFGTARFHDMIEVRCVAEGTSWQVVDVRASIDTRLLDFENCPALDNPIDTAQVWKAELLEIRQEAEQMLGSLKDQTRVSYAKLGTAPKTLTGDAKVSEEELAGFHFKVRNKVYKKPDLERAALVAEPLEEAMQDALGWCAIYYNYASGQPQYKWYTKLEDLEADLKAFETAK